MRYPIVGGTPMDIVIWLRSLGLGKYEAAFRENEIDETVLLDAIVALRNDAVAKTISVDAATRSGTPTPPPEDRAERRQVTVIFSDLVGSTALSARMDPEDLREIISGYQKCVAETVQRFGGFVAKYMGDGVLVYFGYPQAHEDDAERAVLLLRGAGPDQVANDHEARGDADARLEGRVGLQGGETPNLAARLQGIAEPNRGCNSPRHFLNEERNAVSALDDVPPDALRQGLAAGDLVKHASLMARLDRLGPAKEVAQIGA